MMSQSQGLSRPKSKIEKLVELVFGLSLSVSAIALIAGAGPTSPAEINIHIGAFIFTFAFVITTWMVYTSQMSVLPIETSFVTSLNIIMLLFVALIPYLLNNILFPNPSLNSSDTYLIKNYLSSLFALDLAATLGVLATFSHIISVEEKKLVPAEIAKVFRQSRNVQTALSILILFSLAPFFWSWTIFTVPARFYIWVIPIIVYWIRRYLQQRHH
jgi:hypothetical protein